MEGQQATSSNPTPEPRPAGLVSTLAACVDWPLWGCLFVGALVRVYAFGGVPPGLHQDEASAGYDAYALLNYGVDRHGFHNPVAFVAWGSGMFALVSYAAMPFIALLGLTPVAVRLPFLIAGVGSLWVFARLVRTIDGRSTARVAAFLLAICPWHIIISRWALDSNLLPAVLLAAVAVGVESLRRPWLLPLSFALFGLSLYAYGTAYVAVPIYLALVIPYALFWRQYRVGPLMAAVIFGAVVALPALLYVLVNAQGWDSIITPWLSIPRLPGVPRFETVGNFHVWEPQFFSSAARNYWQAAQLFFWQRDENLTNAVPGFGLIYLFSMPVAAFGFVLLARRVFRREFTAAYFLFAWCLVSLLLPAFVLPNINRLNVALVPLVYCTALGVSFLRDRWRILFRGALAVYAVAFVAFVWSYFTSYPDKVGAWFYPQFTTAIRAASVEPQGRICITHGINLPYIFVLFATREDPREFLRTVKYENPGAEFENVSSYGRYLFGLPETAQRDIEVYLLYDAVDYPAEAFDVQKFGNFIVLRRKR